MNRVFASVAESDDEIDLTVFSCAGESSVRAVQMQSGAQVQSGPGQVQSSAQVQSGPRQVQSGAQVQSGPVQVQSGAQVQSGPVQVQSGAQVQSGPVQVQSGAQVQSGPVQVQSGAQVQSGPVSGQQASAQVSARASWYDMSCTDGDTEWVVCGHGSCDQSSEYASCPVQSVIRAASFGHGRDSQGVVVDEVTEVVLDSGADESCLPYAYCKAGYAADVSQPASFSDAQGNALKAYGWRYAQVVLDNGVTFRERFLVTDVTSPLLACGKLYKAGWSVQHMNNELVLTKGSRRVPVRFRHNSLVVEGSIRAVMSKPESCQVRVVTLSPVLERMVKTVRSSSRSSSLECMDLSASPMHTLM